MVRHGCLGVHQLTVELAFQGGAGFALAAFAGQVTVQLLGKLPALAHQLLVVGAQVAIPGFVHGTFVAFDAVVHEQQQLVKRRCFALGFALFLGSH